MELFDESTPFDMSTRNGSDVMTLASTALDDKWDGSIPKLPPFLTALKKQTQHCKWNAVAPHGILEYTVGTTTFNLLSEYHSIPMANLEAVLPGGTSMEGRSKVTNPYVAWKGEIKSPICFVIVL